jgi:hypothetical protein
MALSWPLAGAAGTQINITLGTVQALTQGAYTILSLTKPKSSRGAVLAAKVSASIRREIIIDTNALYGEGDFVGFPGMVAGDWHWIAQTKAAGSAPLLHYRKDITAGGSVVSGTTGASLHADYAAATALQLGQGDNESRDDHALIAVWFRQLSVSEINSIFGSLSVVPVLALAPDALWAGNIPDPAALKDITGHGNNASSVAGPGTILAAADPTGMDWATLFADSEMGSSETFDPNTVGVEVTVPAGTAYRFSSIFPAVAGTTPLFRLYDSGGTLIAGGAFDSTTVDVRNWFTPSAPIHLAAGTYRICQYVSRYRFVSAYITAPFVRNGVTIQRGVFAGGTDAVPNTSSTVWFGLDMEFIADAGGSPVTVPDPAAGGVGAAGQADGRALGDASGGAGVAGQTDGRALGDSSGAVGFAGTADGLALGDASGGGGTGGTGDPVAIGGGSGGVGSGGQPDGLALGSGSGAVGAGGQADTLPGAAVVIQDTSGGMGAGGQPDAIEISQVVHDTVVMPVLLSALACMQGELAKVAAPPAIFTVRPGDSFEPSADPWFGSECCAGVAWVRLVSDYETDVNEYPQPLDRPVSNGCPPDSRGVVIELGVNRCMPVAGDNRGTLVTPAQWLAATQAQMDDGAALRRVLCCLRELYDASDVASGQVNPLPLQGGCGGVSMQVTIRRNACDC